MLIEFHHRLHGPERPSCHLFMALADTVEGIHHAEQLIYSLLHTRPWYTLAFLYNEEQDRIMAVFSHDKDSNIQYLVAKDQDYCLSRALPQLYPTTRLTTCVLGEDYPTAEAGEVWATDQLQGEIAMAIMLTPDGRIYRAWERSSEWRPSLVATHGQYYP